MLILVTIIFRYKVQTSIAQKQRDAQLKSSPSVAFPSPKSKAESASAHTVLEHEVQKWKSAYETAVTENEHLRSRSEEVGQASQWRQRFETCERERNEALERLRSLLEIDTKTSSSNDGNTDFNTMRHDLLGPGAIYQKYLALKEEFEVSCLLFSNAYN